MSEGRRATQLAGRNPSIRLTPLPTGSGNTLQPFSRIRGSHRIHVDADILGEETGEGSRRLPSRVKDLRRSAQAPAYGGLRELSCGRARVDEKPARRRGRRVSWIRVAKISRCKHDGFLVENLGRGNRGAFGGEKYSLCESRTNQVD
jgi:hypothetical protein